MLPRKGWTGAVRQGVLQSSLWRRGPESARHRGREAVLWSLLLGVDRGPGRQVLHEVAHVADVLVALDVGGQRRPRRADADPAERRVREQDVGPDTRLSLLEEPVGGTRARSGPSAKTASPSISWISKGGESSRMTSPSNSAMIGGPCSSSVAVTKAVNPEMSARTSTPSSI
jgi:hypothetical protein